MSRKELPREVRAPTRDVVLEPIPGNERTGIKQPLDLEREYDGLFLPPGELAPVHDYPIQFFVYWMLASFHSVLRILRPARGWSGVFRG